VRGSPRAPQYAAGTYRLPAGKIPGPEDMTGAALFLASGDAHHVTGSYMIADGGYSMLGA
jgi:3-oxoacyl-[acyl-carrier protein] reductase